MSGKRKRVVLTIKAKLDILRQLEAGGSSRQLAGAYGIGETTVRDIRKNRERLLRYARRSDSAGLLARRKAMKPSAYAGLDRAMLAWLRQQRAKGQPVSGPLCARRAEFFFCALGLRGRFNPAAGWLARFRQRHSLRGPRARRGDGADADADADERGGRLGELLRRLDLRPEQVYHAREAGLWWRRPPAPGAAPDPDPARPEPEPDCERVAVLCCANATGAHKLKLCVVGRARPPRALALRADADADTANLPVSYLRGRRGAWLDPPLFRRWFRRAFVPQVREHLRAQGLRDDAAAVLLLRASPAHPAEHALRSDDGRVFARYLPPGACHREREREQRVLAALRANYRLGLLRASLDEGDDLRAFWGRLTLLDALYQLAAAWGAVEPATIQGAWGHVLPAPGDRDPDPDRDPDGPGSDSAAAVAVAAVLRRTRGLQGVSAERLEAWLQADGAEPGYEVLSDGEIVRRARGRAEEDEDADADDDDRDGHGHGEHGDDSDPDPELVPETRLDHAAALRWTESLLAYLEQQGDAVLPDRLVLRKLRATIRNKQKASGPTP